MTASDIKTSTKKDGGSYRHNMKYINRELKGTYGYIKKQLIFETVKTVILFAMAFGIFFLGYLTLGTRKSLWSVLAVLALLPASRSLVGLIMLARFRSLSKEKYQAYLEAASKAPSLYESVITTSERAYYIPVMIYGQNTLTAYAKDAKGDKGKLVSHLENVLKKGSHSAAVRIFDDEDAYLRRAREIDEKISDEDTKTAGAIFRTIKAVSL